MKWRIRWSLHIDVCDEMHERIGGIHCIVYFRLSMCSFVLCGCLFATWLNNGQHQCTTAAITPLHTPTNFT